MRSSPPTAWRWQKARQRLDPDCILGAGSCASHQGALPWAEMLSAAWSRLPLLRHQHQKHARPSHLPRRGAVQEWGAELCLALTQSTSRQDQCLAFQPVHGGSLGPGCALLLPSGPCLPRLEAGKTPQHSNRLCWWLGAATYHPRTRWLPQSPCHCYQELPPKALGPGLDTMARKMGWGTCPSSFGTTGEPG